MTCICLFAEFPLLLITHSEQTWMSGAGRFSTARSEPRARLFQREKQMKFTLQPSALRTCYFSNPAFTGVPRSLPKRKQKHLSIYFSWKQAVSRNAILLDDCISLELFRQIQMKRRVFFWLLEADGSPVGRRFRFLNVHIKSDNGIHPLKSSTGGEGKNIPISTCNPSEFIIQQVCFKGP